MASHRRGSGLRGAGVLLAALLLGASGAALATEVPGDGADAAGASASVEAVAPDAFPGFFEAVVFGADPGTGGGRSVLIRADRPMELRLYGPRAAAFVPFVEAHAAVLTAVTGLSITVALATDPDDRERRNGVFAIHIGDKADFLPLYARSWIPGRLALALAPNPCSFVTRGRETVEEALITIDTSNQPDSTIRHCLAEETTQALGLFGDSNAVRPSLFNDLGLSLADPEAPLPDTLFPIDRRALETLFRFDPGTSRAAVMATLSGR